MKKLNKVIQKRLENIKQKRAEFKQGYKQEIDSL